MFKKPFKVKSNTQMKCTNKKKLRSDFARLYPTVSETTLKEVISEKDNFNQLKILTSGGDIIYLYCREKEPVLFSHNDKLYPTLYLLWRCPQIAQILAYFTTASEVVSVLQNGADFMCAGIISQSDEKKYGNVIKDELVYLNSVENKAPYAIGFAALSSDDMYMAAGRGKCVRILHIYGDELCKYGAEISLPTLGPVFYASENQSTEVEKLSYSAKLSSSDKTELENTVPIQNLDIETKKSNHELLTADDILLYCFVKALNSSLKSVKLPILISNFYKLHMIPCCPEGMSLDIKKTKFKKLSKFMFEMEADNVVKIEETSPGVESLVHVNYSHYLVSGFVDHYRSNSIIQDCVKPVDTTEISEKYSVTNAVLPLFSEFLVKKGDSLTSGEARKYIAEYIRKFDLPVSDDRSMVKLNDVLKNIYTHGNNEQAPEIVKWEDIMNQVFQKMSRSFKVTNNAAVFAQREQKGKLPHIDIRIANKSGNKKVTIIDNLEIYGINLEEFSRECQRGVAASATINHIPGLKSSQLQIQGNQVNFIEKILTGKYSIPKKYINGLHLAPKKK